MALRCAGHRKLFRIPTPVTRLWTLYCRLAVVCSSTSGKWFEVILLHISASLTNWTLVVAPNRSTKSTSETKRLSVTKYPSARLSASVDSSRWINTLLSPVPWTSVYWYIGPRYTETVKAATQTPASEWYFTSCKMSRSFYRYRQQFDPSSCVTESLYSFNAGDLSNPLRSAVIFGDYQSYTDKYCK